MELLHILLLFGFYQTDTLSITISAPSELSYKERNLILDVNIENQSKKTLSIRRRILQPGYFPFPVELLYEDSTFVDNAFYILLDKAGEQVSFVNFPAPGKFDCKLKALEASNIKLVPSSNTKFTAEICLKNFNFEDDKKYFLKMFIIERVSNNNRKVISASNLYEFHPLTSKKRKCFLYRFRKRKIHK